MSTPVDAIVVNTSPLLALDACNHIEVLRSLYARIIVPEEVDRELRAGQGRALLPEGLSSAHRNWIQVVLLPSQPKASLLAKLDAGEASVIALALHLSIAVVLIDERAGWRVAKSEGLKAIGSVGIILEAKKKGIITEVSPYLHAMLAKGIHLSQKVVANAIIAAGETP